MSCNGILDYQARVYLSDLKEVIQGEVGVLESLIKDKLRNIYAENGECVLSKVNVICDKEQISIINDLEPWEVDEEVLEECFTISLREITNLSENSIKKKICFQ